MQNEIILKTHSVTFFSIHTDNLFEDPAVTTDYVKALALSLLPRLTTTQHKILVILRFEFMQDSLLVSRFQIFMLFFLKVKFLGYNKCTEKSRAYSLNNKPKQKFINVLEGEKVKGSLA